jgi:hypothetical protein
MGLWATAVGPNSVTVSDDITVIMRSDTERSLGWIDACIRRPERAFGALTLHQRRGAGRPVIRIRFARRTSA